MDNLETHDTRLLLPMTGFSIEPGVYLTGDFGVRSEINVALTAEARRDHRRRAAARAAAAAGVERWTERPPAASRRARASAADALARSRPQPARRRAAGRSSDFDEERAAALCAAICRNLLGDFAPALLLLAARRAARVQALLAYARTLFDFARQRGVEGERLAQINRWEFTLESALAGQPVGQPVFVAMAREHARRALAGGGARRARGLRAGRRATQPRPATPVEAPAPRRSSSRRRWRPPSWARRRRRRWSAFGGALLRLHALQHLGEAVAAGTAGRSRRASCRRPTARRGAAAGRGAGGGAARVPSGCARASSRAPRAAGRAAARGTGGRRPSPSLAGLALLARVEEADASSWPRRRGSASSPGSPSWRGRAGSPSCLDILTPSS